MRHDARIAEGVNAMDVKVLRMTSFSIQYQSPSQACLINQCNLNSIATIRNLSWWRHQMEIFSALLALCAGNSSVTGEFPAQRPVTRNFGAFFDLHLNKRLHKQSWGWWFETKLCPLWRHRNDYILDARHKFLHLIGNICLGVRDLGVYIYVCVPKWFIDTRYSRLSTINSRLYPMGLCRRYFCLNVAFLYALCCYLGQRYVII